MICFALQPCLHDAIATCQVSAKLQHTEHADTGAPKEAWPKGGRGKLPFEMPASEKPYYLLTVTWYQHLTKSSQVLDLQIKTSSISEVRGSSSKPNEALVFARTPRWHLAWLWQLRPGCCRCCCCCAWHRARPSRPRSAQPQTSKSLHSIRDPVRQNRRKGAARTRAWLGFSQLQMPTAALAFRVSHGFGLGFACYSCSFT